MVRFAFGALAVLGLCVAGARADDQNQKSKDDQNKNQPTTATHKGEKEAKITHVDTDKGTVTVQMTDKNGKHTEKTFHLTGEVRYFDSTGRVAAADVFRTGDYVLVVEEGRLKQMRKSDKNSSDHGGTNKSKSGSSSGKTTPPGGI